MQLGASRHDSRILIVKHATELPNAEAARKLLERIRRNADALLHSRGWRVVELVELCCCKAAPECARGDTEGWCIADSSLHNTTAQKIAIRLRETKGKGHGLLDFESVFGCMIHELAHIIHDKHTKGFHRLMNELQEEWERLEAAGRILDEAGFPTIGGHRIGSAAQSAFSSADGPQGFGSFRRYGSIVETPSLPRKRRLCEFHSGAKTGCGCSSLRSSEPVNATVNTDEEAMWMSIAVESSAKLARQEEERAFQIAVAMSTHESTKSKLAVPLTLSSAELATQEERDLDAALALSELESVASPPAAPPPDRRFIWQRLTKRPASHGVMDLTGDD